MVMCCCASCGKAESDDIKLRKCTACKLVKYCSVECQKNHRPKHKRACKKRASEIRDDALFTQPDSSHLGECPICLLPLPLYREKSRLMSCCSKHICLGCDYANQNRELDQGLERRCAFCRHPTPKSQEEADQHMMNRVDANCPVAFCEKGMKLYGQGDAEGAFQYWTKAAELGDIRAHYELSCSYRKGHAVQKNMKKAVYHMEEAAIGGHDGARHNLGCEENEHGRMARALKHLVIAAKLGNDDSLEALHKGFIKGIVSNEDYTSASRGHQAAIDATKSELREEAFEYFNSRGQLN
jgi:TPR repeat protein